MKTKIEEILRIVVLSLIMSFTGSAFAQFSLEAHDISGNYDPHWLQRVQAQQALNNSSIGNNTSYNTGYSKRDKFDRYLARVQKRDQQMQADRQEATNHFLTGLQTGANEFYNEQYANALKTLDKLQDYESKEYGNLLGIPIDTLSSYERDINFYKFISEIKLGKFSDNYQPGVDNALADYYIYLNSASAKLQQKASAEKFYEADTPTFFIYPETPHYAAYSQIIKRKFYTQEQNIGIELGYVEILIAQGKNAEAQKHLEDAYNFFKKNHYNLTTFEFKAGILSLNLNDLPASRNYFESYLSRVQDKTAAKINIAASLLGAYTGTRFSDNTYLNECLRYLSEAWPTLGNSDILLDEALYDRAYANLYLSKFDEAAEDCDKIKAKGMENWKKMLKADIAAAKSDYATAGTIYNRLLDEALKTYDTTLLTNTYNGLAQLAYKSGNYSQAIMNYFKAMDLEDYKALYLLKISFTYNKSGDEKNAWFYLKQAQYKYPDYAPVYYEEGELAMKDPKREKKAIKYYQQAADLGMIDAKNKLDQLNNN